MASPYRWSLLLLTIIVGSLSVVGVVHAQDIGAKTVGSSLSFTDIGNGIIWGATTALFALSRFLISMSLFFLRVLIEFAKYNGYMDAPPVIQGWYLVRDMANMFFIVALLIIAFATILGLESYEWKKSLVKIVIAAVLINFSRLICQIALDASHVVTIGFLNAVEGAAGGNIIQMLHLDSILKMAGDSSQATMGSIEGQKEELRVDLFVSSITAVLFSLIASLSLMAYAAVMGIRIAVLWVLMILSPLAFVLQAIPQTQSAAQEFWQEFIKYVTVGPILAFFLWLSFASFGAGDINKYVGIPPEYGLVDQAEALEIYGQPKSALNEISTWENMSSFLISVIFLMVGLQRVGKIGVVGSSFVDAAYDMGKQAIVTGSGYAMARWGVGKVADTATSAIKAGAYYAPIVGGKRWEQRWQNAKSMAAGVTNDMAAKGGPWYKNPVAGFIRQGIRNEKRVKDLEDIAEKKKELAEKSVSSNTSLTRKVLTGEQKSLGKIKKELDAELELLNENSQLGARKDIAEFQNKMLTDKNYARYTDGKQEMKKVKDPITGKEVDAPKELDPETGKMVASRKTLAEELAEKAMKADTAEGKVSTTRQLARQVLVKILQDDIKKNQGIKDLHSILLDSDSPLGKLILAQDEAHKAEIIATKSFEAIVSKVEESDAKVEDNNRNEWEKMEGARMEEIKRIEKFQELQGKRKARIDKLTDEQTVRMNRLDNLQSRRTLSPADNAEIDSLAREIKENQIEIDNATSEHKNGEKELEQMFETAQKSIFDLDGISYAPSKEAVAELVGVRHEQQQAELAKLSLNKKQKDLQQLNDEMGRIEKQMESDDPQVKASANNEKKALEEKIIEAKKMVNEAQQDYNKSVERMEDQRVKAFVALGYDGKRDPETGKDMTYEDVDKVIKKVFTQRFYDGKSLTFKAAAAETDEAAAKQAMSRAVDTFKSNMGGDRTWRLVGVDLPNSNSNFAEARKKELGPLRYRQTVDMVLNNAKNMIARRLRGETPPDEDVDMSAALLLKSVEHQNWEDVFAGIWNDPELKAQIADRLGWTNGKVTAEKVGQMQALLATGFDIDLEEQQTKLNHVMEEAFARGENPIDKYSEYGKKTLGEDGWNKFVDKQKKYGNNIQLIAEATDDAVKSSHYYAGGHADFVKETGMIMRMPASMATRLARQTVQRLNKNVRASGTIVDAGLYDGEHGLVAEWIPERVAVMFGELTAPLEISRIPARSQLQVIQRQENELVKPDSDDYVVFGDKKFSSMILSDFKDQIKDKTPEEVKQFMETNSEFKEAVKRQTIKHIWTWAKNAPETLLGVLVNTHPQLKKDLKENMEKGVIKNKLSFESQGFDSFTDLIRYVNEQAKEYLKADMEGASDEAIEEAWKEMEIRLADKKTSKQNKTSSDDADELAIQFEEN